MLALPASAFATSSPTVNVTAYSKTVTGNIGGTNANGVTATVTLTRGNAPMGGGSPPIVDTMTSAATSGGNGNWTVTLPTHAPGDFRDMLAVSYSGIGARVPGAPTTMAGPTGTVCGPNGCQPAPSLMSFLSEMVSVNPAGTSMSIDCSNAPGGGACSGVTASVDGGAPITATGGPTMWTATLPSVTPSNAVTVTATVPVTDSFTGEPSNFTLTVAAPLPGATPTQGFVPLGPPVCDGDLVTKQVVCNNLVQGTTAWSSPATTHRRCRSP